MFAAALVSLTAAGQQNAQQAAQPPVKVTVLNVCAPSDADARQISAMLDRIPAKPAFIADFEIARGITTVEGGRSRWVRARHEFAASAPFTTAQYTISTEGEAAVETLVLRLRDPKDFVQVMLEARVSAGRPAEVAAADTPASRIRLERNGGNSIVLARCADQDQSAREPMFNVATRVFADYRKAFHAPELANELARLPGAATPRR